MADETKRQLTELLCELDATLVLKDKDENVLCTWKAIDVTEAGSGDASLCLEVAKQATDNYRYFGTLRALITWLPAIIVITIMSYISEQLSADYSLWPQVIPTAILAATLFVIYRAQKYLQTRQLVASLIARFCEQKLSGRQQAIAAGAATYYEYKHIVAEALNAGLIYQSKGTVWIAETPQAARRDGKPIDRKRADGASRYLYWFFVILFVGYLSFVVYENWCYISQIQF